MADRSDYLRQLQDQLNAWAQWAKQLQEQALESAAQMRGDAQASYEHRAGQVSELIAQGKEQMERVSSSTDEGWRDIGAGAEQIWSGLQSAAAALALQVKEKIRQPAPKRAKAKKKPAAKKSGAKQKTVVKKKVKAVKRKVVAAKKKVQVKAKVARVKAKVRGKIAKKKVKAKVKSVRRKVAKTVRKAARKKK